MLSCLTLSNFTNIGNLEMNGLSGCRTLYWRSAGKRVLCRYIFLWTVPLEMDVCTSSVPLKKMLARLIEQFMAGGLTVGIPSLCRRRAVNFCPHTLGFHSPVVCSGHHTKLGC